jgi:uncharacterized protein (TIGR03118 family)
VKDYIVSIRDYGIGISGRAAVLLRVLGAVFCLLLAQQAFAEEAGEGYTPTNLVSNILGRAAGSSDSSLVNCWGMAADTQGGPWWVADEGKGRATVYSNAGAAFPFLGPISVTVPVVPGGINDYSTPIGIVYNGAGDFELAPAVPSRFIFVTRDGSIAGWNIEQDPYEAVVVRDNSPEAVYTGAALASMKNGDGRDVLYVANFGRERIDAFGPDFGPLTLEPGAFTDPDLPDGFSPYNVQNIDGELWITFAMAGPDGRTAVPGRGLGYVDVFDARGVLLMRLEHGPWFDAPWGIAMAPGAGFGKYSGSVLVGNSGSGRIAAFDAASGSYLGLLKNGKDDPIAVPDLHGLGFGNGGFAGPVTTLYFTAGSRAGLNLFGSIKSGSAPETGTVMPAAGTPSGY